MIEVATNLYVGASIDEEQVTHCRPSINAVLVTAHDLVPSNDWSDKVEYMHVGLVDGPGNRLSAYHAAVLALMTLVKRGEGHRVLVCDHNGGRSLAVVIMYLYLIGECPSWEECVERLKAKWAKVPAVHDVHRKAFFLMDWGMMARVLEGEV